MNENKIYMELVITFIVHDQIVNQEKATGAEQAKEGSEHRER